METNRKLFWVIGKGSIQPTAKAIMLHGVLLPLQLCLGLWQIVRLTPLWALINCSKSWLLMTLFPGLSWGCSDYNKLKEFDGRVFKRATCYVIIPRDLPTVPVKEEDEESLNVEYLGQEFVLMRKVDEKSEKISKLIMNGEQKYYITNEIWHSIRHLGEVAAEKIVFVRNYKEIWEEVVTGRVMSLEEVLDSVILDNHTVSRLDHEYFLPVDLTLSEDKILKVLNLMGLFLQTQKHIHWLLPGLLSFTAAVVGFSTKLRRFVYGKINMLFCCIIHLLCNQLAFKTRRQAYSLGNWIENLKPSNDLQAKIVRGRITAIIAGGAKLHMDGEPALLRGSSASEIESAFNEEKEPPKPSFECGTFVIECKFNQNNGKCSLKAGEIASVDIDCNIQEAKKLFEFAAHMAATQSGSLKSYDHRTNTVHVRRFRESVVAYVRSGYPPLYQMELNNVEVR